VTDHHDHITPPPRHIYTMRSALDSMIGCIQCREPHVLFHRCRFVVAKGRYRLAGGNPHDANFAALIMLFHANTARYDHELHQLGPRA
jgi:hypothetical protein